MRMTPFLSKTESAAVIEKARVNQRTCRSRQQLVRKDGSP